MLWYKGWLETRFRLLAMVALLGLILTMAHSRGVRTPAGIKAFIVSAMYLGFMIPIMFAGAGVATQPAIQATKGLHGSMLFTLSLPVSRLKLLAVRAGLGWLELAAVFGAWCGALWIVFPVLRDVATPVELFGHGVVLLVCGSGVYAINVLLATFLDDLWRIYGSCIASGALWWLFNHTPLAPSANIFRAMGEGSPLVAHTMPWTAMSVSLSLAAVLFFTALKIAEVREY